MARRNHAPSPTLGLVLIRVFIGGVLLVHGWRWVKTGGLDGRVVLRSVRAALSDVPPWLHWWGEHAVLMNPDAIAFFWRWGALLGGVAFLLGALVRPVGLFVGLFLAHAIAFGAPQQSMLFLVLLVSCLGCALAGAGRRAGLDSVFDQHFPGWVTWSRRRSTAFLS